MTAANGGQAKMRKRGGQKGNLNALSHGFYSRHMQAIELGDLDVAVSAGLDDEIAMLKVTTRRLFALASMKTLDNGIAIAGALGACAIRLAGMMRIRKAMGGEEDAAATAINQALTEVMKEMHLYV